VFGNNTVDGIVFRIPRAVGRIDGHAAVAESNWMRIQEVIKSATSVIRATEKSGFLPINRRVCRELADFLSS
jgi:hypothetical protein